MSGLEWRSVLLWTSVSLHLLLVALLCSGAVDRRMDQWQPGATAAAAGQPGTRLAALMSHLSLPAGGAAAAVLQDTDGALNTSPLPLEKGSRKALQKKPLIGQTSPGQKSQELLHKETSPGEITIRAPLLHLRGASEGELSRAHQRKTAAQVPPSCAGRRVLVYQLPESFSQVLTNCSQTCPNGQKALCENLPRDGLGRDFEQASFSDSYNATLTAAGQRVNGSTYRFGPWLPTEQHMLGLLLNKRMESYDCLVADWQQADAFYVPALFGLFDLCQNQEYFAARADELEGFIQRQPGFRRRGGVDHFLVVGQQIWSFARASADPNVGWGAYLINRPALSKMQWVSVERISYEERLHSIPYPTAFHPATQKELDDWVQHVRHHPREHLISIAGGRRPSQPLRTATIDACDARKDVCTAVDCGGDCPKNFCFSDKGFCADPRKISTLLLASTFCLQPPGDSYTRRAVMDSMLAGCIPVLFKEDSFHKQYSWHLPGNRDEVSVLFDGDKVQKGELDFVAELQRIPAEKVEWMRRRILETIPRLVIRDHTREGAGTAPLRDALDVGIDGLLADIQAALRRGQ